MNAGTSGVHTTTPPVRFPQLAIPVWHRAVRSRRVILAAGLALTPWLASNRFVRLAANSLRGSLSDWRGRRPISSA
jgi:hypothetical protein